MNDRIKEYFYNLGGASRGIENFLEFLAKYDNPHTKYKTIQVLGTNGKGSTTAMVQKLLENKFAKVATFTSPALIDMYDRIQINRIDISEAEFEKIFDLIHDEAVYHQLGFFETLCAIAFIHFANENVDYAIIEAGIGGVRDCTSVIDAQVRLLTNVGFDHVEVLGNTLKKILLQKVGACRSGDTLITTIDEGSQKQVIKKYCKENNVECIFAKKLTKYDLSLMGEYQFKNAGLASECIKFLNVELTEEEFENSFKRVVWCGRFQNIANNTYIDGAHNIDGLLQSIETANKHFGKNNYKVISSVLRGKDVYAFNKILCDNASETTFTTFDYPRAYTIEEMNEFDVKKDFELFSIIDTAIDSNDNYLFVGSLYFVTEIIKYLKEIGRYND